MLFIDLQECYPRRKDTSYFFDNYFSSVNLMKLLKDDGLLAITTLRKDGVKGA